jgi:formylglycine-generating enzyme required for sulfatase activity
MSGWHGFVSYNRKELPAVRHLARRLQDAGVSLLWDEKLTFGDNWWRWVESNLPLCRCVLVCLGESGWGQVQQDEVAFAVALAKKDAGRRVIPVFLRGVAPDPSRLGLIGANVWFEASEGDGEFRALVNLLTTDDPTAAGRGAYTGNPYKGLEAFQIEDEKRFFGRERSRSNALRAWRRARDGARILSLVGPSGCGKSSLALAGIVPAVLRGELNGSLDWEALVVRPQQNPCRALASAVKRAGLIPGSVAEVSEEIKADHGWLQDCFEGNPKLRGRYVLLVVDQLEEVFTQCADAENRLAFLRNVARIAVSWKPSVPAHVLLTIRADHFHLIAELGGRVQGRFPGSPFDWNIYVCHSLQSSELEAAIVQPAAGAGYSFAEGLVDLLVQEARGEPGYLPLLQFLLLEMFNSAQGEVLSWSDYQNLGGLSGALEKKAEELASSLSESELEVLRRIMLRLVSFNSPPPTRRSEDKGALVEMDAAVAPVLLERLIGERLLTAGETDVEIAHESLVQHWPRLDKWMLDEARWGATRERFYDQVRTWIDTQEDPAYLYRGTLLNAAKEWVETTQSILTIQETRFLQQSIERDEEIEIMSDAAVLDQLESSAPSLLDRPREAADWLARADRVLDRLEKIRNRLIQAERPTERQSSGTDDEKVRRETLTVLRCRAHEFSNGLRFAIHHRLTVGQTPENAFADEWARCIEIIADPSRAPRYGGLRLTPQPGLVPMGPDSRSGFWEFWHRLSGQAPERNSEGSLRIADHTGIVLILIPGGRFLMGAQAADPDAPGFDPMARADEKPVHEVELAPFFIGKWEVTQGQWLALTLQNPSYFRAGTSGEARFEFRNPVDSISWEACMDALGQYGLVLPTEAQWEYAARGGTTAPWFVREAELSAVGNLGSGAHVAVGGYPANPYGLHDTVGNVWEWCRDVFASYEVPPRHGDGLRIGPGGSRVFRGGAFLSYESLRARPAFRYVVKESYKGSYVGLRAGRAVTP